MIQSKTDCDADYPAEKFQEFYNNINHRIALVIASNETNEKIGGILAVEALIRFDGDGMLASCMTKTLNLI